LVSGRPSASASASAPRSIPCPGCIDGGTSARLQRTPCPFNDHGTSAAKSHDDRGTGQGAGPAPRSPGAGGASPLRKAARARPDSGTRTSTRCSSPDGSGVAGAGLSTKIPGGGLGSGQDCVDRNVKLAKTTSHRSDSARARRTSSASTAALGPARMTNRVLAMRSTKTMAWRRGPVHRRQPFDVHPLRRQSAGEIRSGRIGSHSRRSGQRGRPSRARATAWFCARFPPLNHAGDPPWMV